MFHRLWNNLSSLIQDYQWTQVTIGSGLLIRILLVFSAIFNKFDVTFRFKDMCSFESRFVVMFWKFIFSYCKDLTRLQSLRNKKWSVNVRENKSVLGSQLVVWWPGKPEIRDDEQTQILMQSAACLQVIFNKFLSLFGSKDVVCETIFKSLIWISRLSTELPKVLIKVYLYESVELVFVAIFFNKYWLPFSWKMMWCMERFLKVYLPTLLTRFPFS